MIVSGCGGKKQAPSRARFKEEARQIVKEVAPTATVRVTGGKFQAEDSHGRLVMAARIKNANALLPLSNPSQGPVTLSQADWTLYKDGMPSLWLTAPVATWQRGLLTAAQGVHCRSVDGRVTLQGKDATWAAPTNLLTVSAARCQVHDPGRPTLLAEGPAATWQNGLLAIPSGAEAWTADRSASARAAVVRWRAATHALEATGRVRMTSGRLAGAGERLTGDTSLRRFRLTGGRPRVTIYNHPPPLVVAALENAGRNRIMPKPRSRVLLAFTSGLAALAGWPGAAAYGAARVRYSLPAGVTVEANDINGDPTIVHAAGDVVLTGTQGVLRANRIDVALAAQKPASGAARSAVREARATGHVRITSESKPGERMEATGAAGTYWPGTQKATLTGGVTVTMASPQLEEPAVLTGARADMDLVKRSAAVERTEAAPVMLRLRPKAGTASGAGSAAATGPLRLEADRVLAENAVNRVTATGSPVLTGDQGTVRAERIWFDIDPQAREIKIVHAVRAVRIDSQDPERGSFQATAQEAVLDRQANTVVLTGNVQGTHIQPGNPEPERFQGEELTYNLKTGAYDLHASREARARVSFKPKPKAAGAAAGPGKSAKSRR